MGWPGGLKRWIIGLDSMTGSAELSPASDRTLHSAMYFFSPVSPRHRRLAA